MIAGEGESGCDARLEDGSREGFAPVVLADDIEEGGLVADPGGERAVASRGRDTPRGDGCGRGRVGGRGGGREPVEVNRARGRELRATLDVRHERLLATATAQPVVLRNPGATHDAPPRIVAPEASNHARQRSESQ